MNYDRYEQFKEIYMQARDLPDDAQAAFLDQHCLEDIALRKEVDSLLRFHAQSKLETVMLGNGAIGSAVTSSSEPKPLRVGMSKVMHSVLGGRVEKWRQQGLALLATVGVIGVGWWLYLGVRNSLREMRAHELKLVLEVDSAALRGHFRSERLRVQTWVQNPEFRKLVAELTAVDPLAADAATRWRAAPARRQIEEYLRGVAGENVRFALWNRTLSTMVDGTAADRPAAQDERDAFGVSASESGASVLARVFAGETVVRTPHRDELFRGPSPIGAEARPVMSIVVPIHAPVATSSESLKASDPDGGQESKTSHSPVIAALMVRGIGIEDEFHAILQRSRVEETGETYAFDVAAVMISESRFHDQLRALKLIPEDPQATTTLAVHLRDPGGDMTSGYQPSDPVLSRTKTRMALLATAGEAGVDLDGYRDYRGVPVIGAWDWLDDLGFGIASEIDYAEAYHPLRQLRWAFGTITGLLSVCVGLLVVFSSNLSRLKQHVELNEQLGQYTLDRKIAEGGMGTVYLARHARLVRPTAVKLLRPDQVTKHSLAWFEREVRIASSLSHPNTIQIYDFGQTADGIFYFAMEYIDGYTLDHVLKSERTLGVARTVYLLRQICGSLSEAHSRGLIHRDIKPQNIMVCERGGESDFVKVLDFGLVKDLAETDIKITQQGAFVGTPMYMSPERVRDVSKVDARCDIYAVGAVAFRMLTGRDIYNGESAFQILAQAAEGHPPRPSDFSSQPIPAEFDVLIHRCLAADPTQRPKTIEEFLLVLNSIALPDRWDRSEAQRWWQDRRRQQVTLVGT